MAHVQQLVTRKLTEAPLCSRCGHQMVKRQRKQGEHVDKFFWGCSQYPKCRNIKSL